MEIDVTAVFKYGTLSNRKGIIAVLALWGKTRSLDFSYRRCKTAFGNQE